ncbi:hypothetical protein T492DRAFT_1033778 [Pavlovales sp. CCMP2436]|nr:hypothetical protein T492DRAFT_1033778 [Pavlovales sp. CCMP2436]
MARQLPRGGTPQKKLHEAVLSTMPTADLYASALTRPRTATGHVSFGQYLGRTEGAHTGSRMAAMGSNEGHWRATKSPSLSLTRPRSSPAGAPWEKQTTRQQAMDRLINGHGAHGGADFYNTAAAYEYLRRAPMKVDMSKQTDRLTAVTGKLLDDKSFVLLMRASSESAALSSKSRQSAERRRIRGEMWQASELSSSANVERPSSSPSGPSEGTPLSHSASLVAAHMSVQNFADQIGRVPHHNAGIRSAGALPAGAPKRSDLLSSAADHLFR